MGKICCHQQSIKGDYRKLTANENGDHKNITGGRPGVIVGEIYCHQQSIKGEYRKLTANENGDHKNITGGRPEGYSGENLLSPTEY